MENHLGTCWHLRRIGSIRPKQSKLALVDFEHLFGHALCEDFTANHATGEVRPVVTLVTDNGGFFRLFRFEAFIVSHPELRHLRTRVKSQVQTCSRERGFEPLQFGRRHLHEITHGPHLVDQAEDYRIAHNPIRPQEATFWNSPLDIHLGRHDRSIPHFPKPGSIQLPDAGDH